MNATIFGANGAIGRLLVDLFLINGDAVTAYVRRLGGFERSHKNLTVIVGNLFNRPLIEKAIAGADVVMCTLGPALDMSRTVKGNPIADGHRNIIAAMETLQKKRLITLGTTSIHSEDDSKQFWTIVPPIMARILYPNGYREMTEIESLIKSSSLDWTVVRIINPNVKDKRIGYRVSLGNTRVKASVCRENVAEFMFRVAVDNLYLRQMPIVFNSKRTANKCVHAFAEKASHR